METRPNSFPVYVSSQYLTSKQLNETTDFLWQEEKASRYLLKGNGIIQGFAVGFADTVSLKQVGIAAGNGCTVDGNIIQQATNVVYDKGHPINLSLITLPDNSQQLMEKADYDKVKANLNAVEKVLNATEIFPTTSNLPDLPDGSTTLDTMAIPTATAATAFLVFAAVFVKDDSYDNCAQGDCNDRGTLRNYNTRFFLVPLSQFTAPPPPQSPPVPPHVPPQNTLSQQMPLCMAARIKNLAGAGSTLGFYAASFAAWNTSFTALQPYFAAANSGKQLSIISRLLDATEQSAFSVAVNKFVAIVASATATKCEQYYSAFASDLSRSINELIEYYNDYAKKYPLYSTERIEGVIILGGLRQIGLDRYRYYFLPAGDQPVFTFDRNRLKQLFMRTMSLVNNFILQDTLRAQNINQKKISAIPSVNGDAALAHRAIPYYYDVLTNNAVLTNWNPQSSDLQNIFCYYDSAIPTRNSVPDMVAKLSVADWSTQNFFRIEGHVGVDLTTVTNAINQMIINDGLPIQLIACDINYKGPIDWSVWYDSFTKFLTASLQTIKVPPADIPKTDYTFNPFKKIVATNFETSYREPDKIKTILNNVNAYSHVFYNTPAAQPVGVTEGPARAAGAISNPASDPNAVTLYKRAVDQTQLTALIKGYDVAVASVADPNVKKLIILKDLAGLEYCGGVPRGGTLVLLHDSGTVIGDGCLSYYYRVTQSRVFDV